MNKKRRVLNHGLRSSSHKNSKRHVRISLKKEFSGKTQLGSKCTLNQKNLKSGLERCYWVKIILIICICA